MIISRTPFRISFFGGGTEYPNWYRTHGGSVLSASIDKYCYISCRILPPFFEHKTRLVYSQIENCSSTDEIRHPAIRETLRFLKIDYGLEIHYDGDLPARTGLGSSSSFTVGLLHALYAQQGIMPDKRRLALESIHIEQNLIKEIVGSQDQVCAAYGGFNQIDFSRSGAFDIRPITLRPGRIEELNSHLMLFFTELEPAASSIVRDYVEDIAGKYVLLRQMQKMVGKGVDVLHSDADICEFGELLHQAWTLKRSLSPDVSSSHVDELYDRARAAGAVGGMITGAGGGGFLLLFAAPSSQNSVREALAKNIYVPFKFEYGGSQIIFYKPEREDYRDLQKQKARQLSSSGEEPETAKKSQRIRTVRDARKSGPKVVQVTPTSQGIGETER